MLCIYLKTLIGALTMLFLASCGMITSEPFTSFVGDPLQTVYIDDKKIIKPIHVNIIMPIGDANQTSCRLTGTIILPENLTYSSYVEQIFKNSLRLSDRLADDKDLKAPKLKVILHKVIFDSYAGKWLMDGKVYINEQKITDVYSSTTFKSTFDNELACSYAIDKFDDLSRKFVLAVTNHPKVIASLKKA